MTPDWETNLRSAAARMKTIGVPTWDMALRQNGLDPLRWSDGTIDRRFAEHGSRDFTAGGFLLRSAPLAPLSFDATDSSIECTWTTGAGVLRQGWDGTFNEVLEVTPRAVRLGRLNAGAPFLNSHQSGTLGMVIGAVVPGSAKLDGGKGKCRIALSQAADNAGIVADIKAGVIRNVSVGYLIHASTMKDSRSGEVPTCFVTDWEPIEISAVAVPADAAAQIRAFA